MNEEVKEQEKEINEQDKGTKNWRTEKRKKTPQNDTLYFSEEE